MPADMERRKRRRSVADARLRASDSCLPGDKAGRLSFVPSPDGGAGHNRSRQQLQPPRRIGSHEYPPMPSGTASSASENYALSLCIT